VPQFGCNLTSNLTNIEPAGAAHASPMKYNIGPSQSSAQAQPPVFGKPSAIGRFKPSAAAVQPPAQNLFWTPEQTSEFFSPQAVQEAHRQAAWQQYYQYMQHMQTCMTPQHFQHFLMAQHYQQQQQQQLSIMHGRQAQRSKAPPKPRAKEAPAPAPTPAPAPADTELVEEETSADAKQVDASPIVAASVPPPAVVEQVMETKNKYEALGRQELVALAKERGIKANGKTVDIIKVRALMSPQGGRRVRAC
jgi:hypothetical protein